MNFASVDDPDKRPFCKLFLGNPRFSQHEDNEPDKYFRNFEIIHKEKSIIDKKTDGKRSVQAYIDYIAEKKMRSLTQQKATEKKESWRVISPLSFFRVSLSA